MRQTEESQDADRRRHPRRRRENAGRKEGRKDKLEARMQERGAALLPKLLVVKVEIEASDCVAT